MSLRRSRPRPLAATAVAVVILGLSGCSGDEPAPQPPAEPSTPTATPTAADSPTPSAATPTLPAEADRSGKKAAEAFARYWVDTLNASAEELDGSPLRAISADDCTACLGIADSMDSIRRDGGFSEGGDWSIGSLGVEPSIEGWAAGMRIKSASQRYMRSSGTQVKRSKGNEFGIVLEFDRSDGDWLAYNLQFVD